MFGLRAGCTIDEAGRTRKGLVIPSEIMTQTFSTNSERRVCFEDDSPSYIARLARPVTTSLSACDQN